MASLRRALGYGLAAWLVPFLISFCLFPVRQANRPLFESLMGVVLAGTASVFLTLYFRRVERCWLREAAIVGMLWTLISLALDLPLFLFGGPMKMPFPQYMADIGMAYLEFPAIAVPIGWMLTAQKMARA